MNAQNKKTTFYPTFSLLFLAVTAFILSFVLLPAAAAAKTDQSADTPNKDTPRYYILNLLYDFDQDSLDLNTASGFNNPIALGDTNHTQDSGAGSQFYAQVISKEDRLLSFPDNSDKFFLGRWEKDLIHEDVVNEKGEFIGSDREIPIKRLAVSIPYLKDGHRLEIHRTQNDETVLVVSVPPFDQTTPNNAFEISAASNQATAPGAAPTNPPSATSGWIYIIVAFIGLGIVGAVVYVMRKIKS